MNASRLGEEEEAAAAAAAAARDDRRVMRRRADSWEPLGCRQLGRCLYY